MGTGDSDRPKEAMMQGGLVQSEDVYGCMAKEREYQRGKTPVTKEMTEVDGKLESQRVGKNQPTRKATKKVDNKLERRRGFDNQPTIKNGGDGEQKRIKSGHIAICISRGVARTFGGVQFYYQRLIFPSHF